MHAPLREQVEHVRQRAVRVPPLTPEYSSREVAQLYKTARQAVGDNITLPAALGLANLLKIHWELRNAESLDQSFQASILREIEDLDRRVTELEQQAGIPEELK